jgi:hypothetical protein
MMEVVHTSETSVYFKESTQCYVPECYHLKFVCLFAIVSAKRVTVCHTVTAFSYSSQKLRLAGEHIMFILVVIKMCVFVCVCVRACVRV